MRRSSLDLLNENISVDASLRLSATISKWLKSQAVREEELEDGTVKETMGSGALDLINKLKGGKKEAVNTIRESEMTIKERYKNENYDLITWFIVSV